MAKRQLYVASRWLSHDSAFQLYNRSHLNTKTWTFGTDIISPS